MNVNFDDDNDIVDDNTIDDGSDKDLIVFIVIMTIIKAIIVMAVCSVTLLPIILVKQI
jgi:hypothetical protein